MTTSNLRDRLTLTMNRRVIGPLFRHSTESSSLADHVAAVGVPDIAPTGQPTEIQTLAGPMRASATVLQAPSDARVTIIWHPGYGERDSVRAVTALFQLRHKPLAAEVVAITPPFHDSMRSLMAGIRHLDPWIAMSATGVGVVEALRRRATNPVIVVGYSLGGFVTLGHLIHYDTADVYAPIASGQRLGTTMSEVHIGARLPRGDRDRVAERLDLDVDLSSHLGHHLVPVQCAHDLLSPASIQAGAYGGPVTTWPVAHFNSRRRLGTLGRPFMDGLIERLTS